MGNSPFSIWLPLYAVGGLGFLCCLADTTNVGVNYGMLGDNLPPPTEVIRLLQSVSIYNAKLYAANAAVLRASGNTGISFIVGIGNEDVASLTEPQHALKWLQQNILLYLPNTQISAIAVGNEVFTGNDTALMSDVLLAMNNLHECLLGFDLNYTISISTPHSLAILQNSYPPSAGSFLSQLAIPYMKPLLTFLSKTQSPFMINAYPFFAYKANPSTVSLDYVLFKEKVGQEDQNTGLIYYNMLDAQVDAIYAAMANLGFKDISVLVSETGWPSKGDGDEAGASAENAQTYNANLIKRLSSGMGTPMRPSVPLKAYIFALFNEDTKPGPISERNYGLLLPSGLRAYDFGLDDPTSYTLYTISSQSFCQPIPSPCTLLLLCSLVALLVTCMVVHCDPHFP